MGLRIIVLLVMGAVLLGWVVFCGVQYVRQSRRAMAGAHLVAHAVCGECGSRFDVDSSELAKTFMSRSRSVTRTKVHGAALVNEPRYSSFSKKVRCPRCGREIWANVENVNELNAQMRPAVLRIGVRWLVVMVAGGLVVLAISAAAMGVANRAAEARTEELRQQQRDALMERYG